MVTIVETVFSVGIKSMPPQTKPTMPLREVALEQDEPPEQKELLIGDSTTTESLPQRRKTVECEVELKLHRNNQEDQAYTSAHVQTKIAVIQLVT